jgi:hypothetical protein
MAAFPVAFRIRILLRAAIMVIIIVGTRYADSTPLRQKPSEYDSALIAGDHHFYNGYYDSAVDAFSISRKINPNAEAPLIGLYHAHLYGGRPAVAFRYADTLRQKFPGYVNDERGAYISGCLGQTDRIFSIARHSASSSSVYRYGQQGLAARLDPFATALYAHTVFKLTKDTLFRDAYLAARNAAGWVPISATPWGIYYTFDANYAYRDGVAAGATCTFGTLTNRMTLDVGRSLTRSRPTTASYRVNYILDSIVGWGDTIDRLHFTVPATDFDSTATIQRSGSRRFVPAPHDSAYTVLSPIQNPDILQTDLHLILKHQYTRTLSLGLEGRVSLFSGDLVDRDYMAGLTATHELGKGGMRHRIVVNAIENHQLKDSLHQKGIVTPLQNSWSVTYPVPPYQFLGNQWEFDTLFRYVNSNDTAYEQWTWHDPVAGNHSTIWTLQYDCGIDGTFDRFSLTLDGSLRYHFGASGQSGLFYHCRGSAAVVWPLFTIRTQLDHGDRFLFDDGGTIFTLSQPRQIAVDVALIFTPVRSIGFTYSFRYDRYSAATCMVHTASVTFLKLPSPLIRRP